MPTKGPTAGPSPRLQRPGRVAGQAANNDPAEWADAAHYLQLLSQIVVPANQNRIP